MSAAHRTAAALAALTLVVAPSGARAQAGPAVTDHVVASFDGTPLAATLFVPDGVAADAPAPLVLRTHGWGGSRETTVGDSSTPDPGAGTLARLLHEGYVVLTWDQRGFGCSGGEVRLHDPDVEGRDVTALIDWAVANAPVATDAAGDPVVGMSGGSYAGGVQTAGAAVDGRIDAIAPEISWSDLRHALYPGQVVKQGWVAILYGLGVSSGTIGGLDPACEGAPQGGALDPAIHAGVTEFVTTGRVSGETLAFFDGSSLGSYGRERPVRAPTLVLQGSVDTLFDLTDGYGIYQHVRAQGVPARFVIFCGGHVTCPDSYAAAGDRAYLDDAIVAWFARHLRAEDVDTGAPVSYRTNEGVWRDAATFDGAGAVELSGSATSLPVVPVVDVPDVATLAGLAAGGPPTGVPALPFTAAQPARAGDPRTARIAVARAGEQPLELRGVPEVTLTVSGQAVPLEDALAPLGDLASELPADEVGGVLVGSLGPLGTLTGGLVDGLGGDGTVGGVDGSVHVFVRLVDREADEVVNLQEAAVRAPLAADGATVAVPMPGLAYTLPAGHHLDLEVSTASLLHATGRTPALVAVTVSGTLPVADGVAAPPVAPGADAGPPAAVEPATEPLPASGGWPVLAGLALLVAGGIAAAWARAWAR